MPETAQPNLEHEDRIEAVAALLTQWYTLQLLSAFHPEGTTIAQPPHSPPPSLISSWREAGMSNLVIETLKELPYLSGDGKRELAPSTRPLNYLDDGFAVGIWKDPFGLSTKEEPVEGYLGNSIPLTYCAGEHGCLLLLDLHTNEIYEIGNDCRTSTQPPKDAPEWYHQHYPHEPALEALKDWIGKTKGLVWVPDLEDGIWMQDKDDWNGSGKVSLVKAIRAVKETDSVPQHDAMKQLYFECGWPERFDQEQFLEKYMLLARSRDWAD